MACCHRQYFESLFTPFTLGGFVPPEQRDWGGGCIGLKAQKKSESTSCLILGSPVTTTELSEI